MTVVSFGIMIVYWMCLIDLESGNTIEHHEMFDPCKNATVLDDDWRHPSEEDKKKCDNKLPINRWYKFRHQGVNGLIAMGPIKENHCSTTGSLSISLQSSDHLYPPPINQSSIYTTCVHVKILGVITCLDHMTLPVIAMTCPNYNVIYYITRTVHICPSAFCVIGNTEKVDEYYWLRNDDNLQPLLSKYVPVKPSNHLNSVLTFETLASNQTRLEMNVISKQLKELISYSINNPKWRNDLCFKNHLQNFNARTCFPRIFNSTDATEVFENVIDLLLNSATLNKSKYSNDSRSIYRNEAGSIINTNDLDAIKTSHKDHGCSNASSGNENEFKPKISSRLCDIDPSYNNICMMQTENVKFVKLNQIRRNNATRWSVVVGSFCDCTLENNTLYYALMWLNWTGVIQNITGSEVVNIYSGLPEDELLPLNILNITANPKLFYCVFWPLCIFIVVVTILLSYYKVQCCKSSHLLQREKIMIVDCDNKPKCITTSIAILSKRSYVQRSRHNTTTSFSGSVQSPKKSVFKMLSINESDDFNDNTFTSSGSKYRDTSASLQVDEKVSSPDVSLSVQTTSTVIRDSSGWIIPLREFEKFGKTLNTVPKMVIDDKRRSRRGKTRGGFTETRGSGHGGGGLSQSSGDDSEKVFTGFPICKNLPVIKMKTENTKSS